VQDLSTDWENEIFRCVQKSGDFAFRLFEQQEKV
jgi:hypothetical protein